MENFGSHSSSNHLAKRLAQVSQGWIVEEINFLFQSDPHREFWEGAVSRKKIGDTEVAKVLMEEINKGLIVTQSCDIDKRHIPWITVVPVYSAKLFPKIDRNQLPDYLINITAPWASSELWIADLRLEMAIEKTLLLNKNFIEGFASKKDYKILAERLGERRQRPAIPDILYEHVVDPFFNGISDLEEKGVNPRVNVEQFRIYHDEIDGKFVVFIYVIKETDSVQLDLNMLNGVVAAFVMDLNSRGITWGGLQTMSYDSLTAREYMTSELIQGPNS